MNLDQLRQNHTILGRYSIGSISPSGAGVDLNKNDWLDSKDVSPDVRDFLEPIVDVDIRALKDYADLNGDGDVFTQDKLGEVESFRAKFNRRDSRFLDKYDERTLTELARDINPFKERVEPNQVSWAIQPQEKGWGQLYIITDKRSDGGFP